MRRIIPDIFFILLILPGFWGCGIKGAPVALDSTIPAPVSDLKVWSRAGGIFLKWTIPTRNIDGARLTDLLGFKVFRQVRPLTPVSCEECPDKFEPVAEIDVDYPHGARLEGGTVLWRDMAVKAENEYVYFVRAFNSYKSPSPESNRVNIFWTEPPAAPAKPTLLKEDRALKITWEHPPRLFDGTEVAGLKGFNIYRRGEGESFGFSPLNAEPIAERQYWDGRVELGKRYCYEVRAVRDFRGSLLEGPGSPVVEGIPAKLLPPSAPTGLVAVFQENGVALRWDENPEPDIAGYNLYRRGREEKEFVKINPRLITENYFLDGSADLRQSYVFRLQAVDSSPSRNESDFSKEAEISFEAPRKN
ncbi:MAG: fibronectin type III domain-containing protein [Thermodesulfobacteriota bacterium]|nr:fibronectin type III domain-containing protein [Thermodesulfobacteriota bacterium]